VGYAILAVFLLWGVIVLFVLPPPQESTGEAIPEEFIAQLNRESPGARMLVDDATVIIDKELRSIQDLRTGYKSSVWDLVASCKGNQVEVLSSDEGCTVARIAGNVFFVDGERRIVAITDYATFEKMMPEVLAGLCLPAEP